MKKHMKLNPLQKVILEKTSNESTPEGSGKSHQVEVSKKFGPDPFSSFCGLISYDRRSGME